MRRFGKTLREVEVGLVCRKQVVDSCYQSEKAYYYGLNVNCYRVNEREEEGRKKMENSGSERKKKAEAYISSPRKIDHESPP